MYLNKPNSKIIFILDNFIFHYVYAVVFITIYILNNNHSEYSSLYMEIFNLITTVLLLFFLLYKLVLSDFKLKINKVDFIFFSLILCIALLTLLTRNYFNFHWIYLIFAYIYFNKHIELNQKFRKRVLTVVFFSVIYQLLTLRFMLIRPVINWYDPNFSGFFLFVLFLFLKYEKMRIMSYVILFSGLLTLSRGYILAITLFFTIDNFNFIKNIIIKLKLNRFLTLLGISLFGLIFIENYFVVEEGTLSGSGNDIEKIYTIADASNQDRFTANVLFKNDLFNNFLDYQFGVDIEYYTANIFRNTPHNAFYSIIINYGIYFTILFFIIFSKIYNRFLDKENIAIGISLFSYYMLLGAGIQGYPGILVFYLLSLNKGKK